MWQRGEEKLQQFLPYIAGVAEIWILKQHNLQIRFGTATDLAVSTDRKE